MQRKDYDLVKSEIQRLLNEIDTSFEPDKDYDISSDVFHAACNLRYVVNTLCHDLVL